MGVEENKALMRRYFAELVSGGDLDVSDELFAADYATDWPIPDMPRGPAQVKYGWAEWRTAFPDWQATVEQQIAEGDFVATRIRATGTHRGELVYRRWGRLAATGRPVRIDATVTVRISAGRIVAMWQDGDFFGLFQQLGVIAPPTP